VEIARWGNCHVRFTARRFAALPSAGGVHNRLQSLLDKQDAGDPLTDAECSEAEGLVDLVELLTLLKLRAEQSSASEIGV